MTNNPLTIPPFGALKIHTFEPVLMKHNHWHGHIEFNYIYNGQMRYLFNGSSVTVPANQFVIFWAAIPHRVVQIDHEKPKNAEICNIYIPLDEFLFWPRLDALRKDLLSGAIITLKATKLDLYRIKQWNDDFYSANENLKDIMLLEIQTMLRRALFDGRDDLLAHVGSSTYFNHNKNHAIKMLQYIHDHYTDNITTENVAQYIGFHRSYADKIFKLLFPISIKKYINHLRLLHARKLLLETSLLVSTITFEAGFGSVSQFYKIFYDQYRQSPQKFRDEMQKN